jgi:hypothetical protein
MGTRREAEKSGAKRLVTGPAAQSTDVGLNAHKAPNKTPYSMVKLHNFLGFSLAFWGKA